MSKKNVVDVWQGSPETAQFFAEGQRARKENQPKPESAKVWLDSKGLGFHLDGQGGGVGADWWRAFISGYDNPE